MKYNLYYLLLICWMLAGTAVAQDRVVKGQVSDADDGRGVVAAHIRAPAENRFTVADERGNFEIMVSGEEGILEVSAVGYKMQKIGYSGEEYLKVEMAPDLYLLNEVKVTAWAGHKSNKETAGAIARLSGDALRGGSGISMQSALNGIPGVRMDQSNLSDSRISIRGQGVRSPWGIRNVKIYLDDIPLTEADGTSRLEGIDLNDLGEAEIIRGPASSIYGAGTGGVIRFRMDRAREQGQSLETSALAGSFGLQRWSAVYRNNTEKMNAYVSYGDQHHDGYRDHSRDQRKFLTAHLQFYPSEDQMITVLANRTSQQSQIPGALTREEFDMNPRQASAGNLDKGAGRDQNWTRFGLGHQYQFSDRWSNTSSVFTYFYDIDHPLAFAYLRNYYQSYGGRTKFDYDPHFSTFPVTFTLGGEINRANTKGTRYVNDQGREGAISGNTDYLNKLYSLFFHSDWSLSPATSLILGVSYNGMSYDVKDYLHEERSGLKEFRPQASPRIALSHHFGEYLSLHGSVSSGFSPPTGSEIQNEDGSVNQDLQAQNALNYELNFKGNLVHSRLAYDLALYTMKMKNELIGQTVQQGITVYHNSGRTTHHGAELALAWQILRESDGKAISRLQANLSGTYSDFRFKEYILRDQHGGEQDFRGKMLPGISPHTISAGLIMESRAGWYGNVHYYFNDRLPLNDGNTDFHPSWSLLNIKAGYEFRAGRRWRIDLYGGIDNVTNVTYSSFNALNAASYGSAGPAYFNPSSPRSFYSGVKLRYKF